MDASAIIKAFVRRAKAAGGAGGLRDVSNKLIDQLFVNGGKALTSSTVNGKSFSFTIQPGTDIASLISALDEAAIIYDEKAADGTLDAYLSARKATRTKAYFA